MWPTHHCQKRSGVWHDSEHDDVDDVVVDDDDDDDDDYELIIKNYCNLYLALWLILKFQFLFNMIIVSSMLLVTLINAALVRPAFSCKQKIQHCTHKRCAPQTI